MRVSFLMDGIDRRTDTLLHDIQTWIQFFSRACCQLHEEDVEDEDNANLTLLTVEFLDPLDAADFWLWRGISRNGRRS